MRVAATLLVLGVHAGLTKESAAFTSSATSGRKITRGSTKRDFLAFPAIESTLYGSVDDYETNRQKRKKQPRKSKSKSIPSAADERKIKKEEVMKKLKEKLEENKRMERSKSDKGILEKLNPFQAGRALRRTIGDLGTFTTLGTGLSDRTKQKYYLDDRFLDGGGSEALLTERNPNMERMERDSYVPEVLVVGATGEVGRMVVRRLLLEGRFRVRVLVRDLYSQTLNLLGTGVTYCQGDLDNIESLEYALTDVDKIVFCAAAPRPDEADFQKKFKTFMKENLSNRAKIDKIGTEDGNADDSQWEQLNSVLEVRSELAEQVDCIGMQNLVTAYQNVRHADYGTPQAAKRSLFKFGSRPEDFNLFAVDDNAEDSMTEKEAEDDKDGFIAEKAGAADAYFASASGEYLYETEINDDEDEDIYYDNDDYYDIEERRDSTVKTQVQWIRNEFGHGVFVGRIPRENGGVGGEAAVISSRLRSREEPEKGINLSSGFAGFIVRLCGDGGIYECFIRTGSYENDGMEYVCKFATRTKRTSKENKSRNKFITCRLPFQNFKPVLRKDKRTKQKEGSAKPFKGEDARFIGFRYRCESNDELQPRTQGEANDSFYIALSYVKVYREQPGKTYPSPVAPFLLAMLVLSRVSSEPEFVYLSDSRIPPIVRNGMVRHDRQQLVTNRDEDGEVILDDRSLNESTGQERSPEETYFKFRGEEILKKSGLRYGDSCISSKTIFFLLMSFSHHHVARQSIVSYTIIRVSGFNEDPSGEASTIDLLPVSCLL
eukprot:scaffold6130_cov131-Cylindrotheca_fusiformis.AAC.8